MKAWRPTSAAPTTKLPRAARGLLLTLTQIAALVMPTGVVVTLVVQRRWRRLSVVVLAALSGAAAFALLNMVLDVARPLSAADSDTWILSARFPSLYYVAGAAAAATVGKPWLPRSWRRTCDVSLIVLGVVMIVVGSAGVPDLLFAVALGAAVGAAILTVLGAPNRRPSAADVALALRDAGLDVIDLTLERAEGGRSQLYLASDGNRPQLREGQRPGQP